MNKIKPPYKQVCTALCAGLILGGCAPAAPVSSSGSVISPSSSATESASSASLAPERAPLDEEGFIRAVIDSSTLNDGTLEITLPESIPAENRLEIEANAFINDTRKGVFDSVYAEGFLQCNRVESWKPGETYRAPLLEGDIPDGTEVSLAVRFHVQGGDGPIVSNGKLTRWCYENGQPVLLADPLYTTAAPETKDGETLITYSEDNGDRFRVGMRLPEGWALKTQEESTVVGFAPLDLYENGERIGTVFYDEFQFYESATGDNYHRMVYSGLMLGSVVNWDNNYTPVAQTDTFGAATCQVSIRRPKEGQANADEDVEVVYHKAVLAHDIGLHRYIAFEFTGEKVTDEQTTALAQSIRFIPV